MSKRVLIFGGNGFVGRYLSKLLECTCDVTVVGREVDIRDKDALEHLLIDSHYDFAINLAAISNVFDAFSKPDICWDVNFGGTYNILMALQNTNFAGKFLFISSSQVYGQVSHDHLPITEDNICLPTNPYGQSKLAAENLCFQFSKYSSFDVVIARPFNHVGAGQSKQFVVSSIVSQIKSVNQQNPELLLGDITSTRDFLHVSDVVRAYHALLLCGRNGEIYNVCSGQETSIEEVALILMKISASEMKITSNTQLSNDAKVQRVVGDNSKIRKHVNWEPKLDIMQTLERCWLNDAETK
ncbi:GDP-mannose 4,6-dehydratase [Paracoccaceae bacterium]|nr:GDP-mannose 4,6-dehydratase [Paracoccaceae bacterium]